MNHSQLRAFHAVASEGSFTRAANVLRVSQPTLSAHVRQLEEGYGVELFERRGRSVQLTEFGTSLKEITTRYFSMETEIETLLSRAKDLLRGHLAIAADSPFYMLPVLSTFSRRYPAVRQSFSFGNTEHVLSALLKGECDVAFLPELQSDGRLHALPFFRDRLVTVVATTHPWAQQRRIQISDLQGETVLLRERGSQTLAVLERALKAAGLRLKQTIQLGSREAVREAAANGLGVGIINEGEIGQDERLHTLAIGKADVNLTEYVACLEARKASPEIAALFEIAAQGRSL